MSTTSCPIDQGTNKGELFYHLFYTVDWVKVNSELIAFTVTYSNCNETKTKEINCKKDECFDKDFFYATCKQQPNFSAIEMMNSSSDAGTIHGGKAGDWSKAKKKTCIEIDETVREEILNCIGKDEYGNVPVDNFPNRKIFNCGNYVIINIYKRDRAGSADNPRQEVLEFRKKINKTCEDEAREILINSYNLSKDQCGTTIRATYSEDGDVWILYAMPK